MINLGSLHQFINRLSKRERLISYGSIFFVTMAFLDGAIVSPAFLKISSLNKEIEETKLMIKKDLRFLTFKKRINEETERYASYFYEANSPEEEMNTLLKMIEDFARKASVYLLYRKPAGFKSEEAQKKYYIDLTCEGIMTQIIDFLYQIESSDKILNVEKLIITPKSEGSRIAQCRITISKINIH